ncbi:MAG: aminopeptidase P family protein [Ruminococcaceae bacterium]|jgi:Xaa-Pro aminopeptidase|nr:aminopeptidase P family protein [Oscillospiraceae bacterium]
MTHLERIANELDHYGLDAMLLTSDASCFYATYFHGEGVTLVTKSGSFYFTDSRYIEAAENRIRGAEIGMTERSKPFVDWINESLARTGVKTVGFEDDTMSVASFHTYREALHCELTPAAGLVRGLRAVKDAEEIRRLTDAQRVSERALQDLLQEIRAGQTEQEIAARLQYLMLRYGAERMSFDPIVASGPNGSMPHAVPSERQIQRGDFITMDFGCVYEGYCSDMTRTVAVGEVSDEQRAVYDIVLRAQLAGIGAARAGVTGAQVDGAARQVIADAGYGAYFGHGFGHSVGVEIHEAPNANPTNDKPLPCGAVISAEPGIYLPGRFGVRIEDVIVIGEDGCTDLALADKSLIVL